MLAEYAAVEFTFVLSLLSSKPDRVSTSGFPKSDFCLRRLRVATILSKKRERKRVKGESNFLLRITVSGFRFGVK